jgi:hypothetical protein
MNNSFVAKSGYTDYYIQVFLENKGYKLYNSKIDNQVDNEKLAKLARKHGFVWDEQKELWFKSGMQ